jgi:hypothetical protein
VVSSCFCHRGNGSRGCVGSGRRSFFADEVVEAGAVLVIAHRNVAGFDVVADIAEDDLCAGVVGVAGVERQRDGGLDHLQRLVLEHAKDLLHGGDDTVRADYLDRTRSLKPQHTHSARANEQPAIVVEGGLGLALLLCGR